MRLYVKKAQIGRRVWINNYPFKVGDRPRCPECGRPNYCKLHGYAYLRWLDNAPHGLHVADSPIVRPD